MPQQTISRPVSLVSVVAPDDMDFLRSWENHLLPLQQAGLVTFWSERQIQSGDDKMAQLVAHLDQADCIVLLLSPDFFASHECIALMEHALLNRQAKSDVINLLLRPVIWQESVLGSLPYLPSNSKPVTEWPNQDEVLNACLRELCLLLHLSLHSIHMPTQGKAVSDKDRERMLQRLRLRYEQMITQSLQGIVQIELRLASRPTAVQNAVSLAFRLPDQPEQQLPPHTTIKQVYELAQQELLILGEPGAGKSTLILELAHSLVEQAERDSTQPLPFLLPLSSWAVKRGPLQEWLIEQLVQLYDMPQKLSQQWIQAKQVLPLLDGLDEMKPSARGACIAAINIYHRGHLGPLVVCSRTNEYEAAKPEKLSLHTAIRVRSLQLTQVEMHLTTLGQPLEALRTALSKNSVLQELATTPLMLQILVLTYHSTLVQELSQKEFQLQKQVWTDYVERMVTRKGNVKRYPRESTITWLSWLACRMRDHNQTIFFLEHLQSDWLSTNQQRTYVWLAIHTPAIITGILISILVHSFFSSGNTDLPSLLQYGVLGGLLGELWQGSVAKQEHQEEDRHVWKKRLVKHFAISISVGLIYGLSFLFYLNSLSDGLSFGTGIGFGSFLLQYLFTIPYHHRRFSRNSATRRWKQVVHFFQAAQGSRALLVTVVIGLSTVLSYGLGVALNYGLSYGLSYGLISLTLGAQMGDIRLTERLRWTKKSLSNGLLNAKHLHISVLLACIIPLFSVLSAILSYGLSYNILDGLSNGLIFGLSLGFSLGLSYWFLLGLFQGIAQEQVADKDRTDVDQGIRRSFRNGVIMGIISGVIIGIIGLLSYVLSYGLSYTLSWGLSWGLISEITNGWSNGWSHALSMSISGAMLIYMLTGGLAVLRHCTIRFLLLYSNAFPRAPQFLNDARTRSLLQPVGGGYSFIHRLLLDYFADLEDRGKARVTKNEFKQHQAFSYAKPSLILPEVVVCLLCALLLLFPLIIFAHTAHFSPTSSSLIRITPQNFRQYIHSTDSAVASNPASDSPFRTYQFTDYIYSLANHQYVSAELGYNGGSYTMLRARAPLPSTQETFNWYYDYKTGTWQIQSTSNGLFISTELRYNGSGYTMLRARASPSQVFGYEQFHLYYDNSTRDNVIQSAANRLYVSAELGYSGSSYAMLRARTSYKAIYVWEQFLV